MDPKIKEKDFDCIAMKRAGAKALLKKLSKMSPEEELKFWADGHKKMVKLQEKIKKNTYHRPG